MLNFEIFLNLTFFQFSYLQIIGYAKKQIQISFFRKLISLLIHLPIQKKIIILQKFKLVFCKIK